MDALRGLPIVAAAVAALTYAYLKPREDRTRSIFSVLSWNVLAAEFTHYNREPPGCVQGHRNPDGKQEAQNQTASRYALVSEEIVTKGSDIVLLQELSTNFWQCEVNPKASAVLEHYVIAHQTNTAGPGTAVLLRKGSPLVTTGKVLSIGASEATGGDSKSATAVQVRLDNALVWVVSVHLTPYKYYPDKVRTHLRLISEALRSAVTEEARSPPRVVFGGDLNAELHEVATLQSDCAFLGGLLSHVPAGGDTGLSADFSTPCYIDHLFISPGLHLVGRGVELGSKAASPYAPAAQGQLASVVGPSDHVWQRVYLAVA